MEENLLLLEIRNLAAEISGLKLEIRKLAADDGQQEHDGPVGISQFRFGGEIFDGKISGRAHSLLRELWAAEENMLDVDDLASTWGADQESLLNTVRGLRKVLNRNFRRHGLPFHVVTSGPKILLVDGPPEPMTAKPRAKSRRRAGERSGRILPPPCPRRAPGPVLHSKAN